jgi:2-hydroxychromene-2-carboxylate isomerase
MADLDFFLDPICPWAWITSRWVVEVQQQRQYDVQWRFISLAVVNEHLVADWYTAEYRRGHVAGLELLRVADAVRVAFDNDAVGRLYTAYGEALHVEGARDQVRNDTHAFVLEALRRAGIHRGFAEHRLDESHDAHLRAETALALARTGKDVGTPIITFHPGTEREASFFGPVIARIPRGDDATKLWDAIEVVATTSGMAELKRSLREAPQFS